MLGYTDIISFVNLHLIKASYGEHVYPLIIKNNNVGIGTTNPTSRLHIYDSSKNVKISGDIYMSGDVKNHQGNIIYADNNHIHNPEDILTSGVVWDNTNNRLGINTSSPSYEVDVSGSVNCTSLFENGTNITSKYLLKNHKYSDYRSGTTRANPGRNNYTRSFNYLHDTTNQSGTNGFIFLLDGGNFGLYFVNNSTITHKSGQINDTLTFNSYIVNYDGTNDATNGDPDKIYKYILWAQYI